MMSIKKYCLVLLLLFARGAYAIPDIQHWQTEQGTPVYFVEAHELPIVDIKIMFDAGSGRDADKPGLALLTNGLLSEGAGGLDADEISRRFENLGANFGSNADADSAAVGLRVLADKATYQPALDTLEKVIAEPDFPEDAFERLRNQTLVSILHKQQSPGALANDAFYAAVYGDHPYARPEEGTEESVKAITIPDIKAFHRQYYVARNAVVAIVGDLSREQAEALAAELVSVLPAGEKAAALPMVEPLSEAKTVRIDHPSSQTHILVGQPGIRRDDPDLFPLYVGNHVLGGGGMVSRLFEQIREKRGLSYSAYSYFLPLKQAGPFVAGLQTRNDQADEALQLLVRQLDTFVQNGPTGQELESSKKNLTGGFPLRIDSNRDIMGYLSMIGFYGLPLDYLQTYNDRIMAVTPEQIKDAFQRHLSTDKFITVMVGPQSDTSNMAEAGAGE